MIYTFAISLGLSHCLLWSCDWSSCLIGPVFLLLLQCTHGRSASSVHQGGTKKSSDPNLQRTCYLIKNNSLVCHYHFSNLLYLLISGGDWWASCFFFVCPTFQVNHFLIHSNTLLHSSALSLYCVESLCWISAPDTPSDQRNWITALCSSLGCTAGGVAMFALWRQRGGWHDQARTLITWPQ